MRCQLDHVVVAAETLEQGIAYVESLLGVTLPRGGEHQQMGTHNALMRLSDDLYFEIIAVAPDLPQPERPRWFGLDDPWIKQALKEQPRLHTWVVRTDSIERMIADANVDLGEAAPLQRGDLNWQFAIPADGHLPHGGIIPSVMQWEVEVHPAAQMADLGCQLQGFEIHHPRPDWVQAVLNSMGFSGEVTLYPLSQNSAPFIRLLINTPDGVKEIHSLGLSNG